MSRIRNRDNEILIPERTNILIPEITLIPLDEHLSFQLRCIQLPARLAYSMKINKAQEQTFRNVRLHLSKPVFAHS